MKPASFEYVRADDSAAVTRTLTEFGDEARVIAGGQSLVPMMALRLSTPDVLVDLTRAEDLQGYELRDETLTVSAAVSARTIELDGDLAERFPLLTESLGYVGHPEIRNRGTVVGSIAHADPAAELPALLLALGGEAAVRGGAGIRMVSAVELFLGPYMTTVGPEEFIAEVTLPAPPVGTGWSIDEVSRRHGDFATVGVITLLHTRRRGRCDDARVVLFGVAATPVRAATTEAALVGGKLDDHDLAEAAEVATADVEVLGDLHGSVAYRRDVARRLVHRSLRRARQRLGGG